MYIISKELQQFAQQIAEAINSVLNMDITIVDTNLIRIAGTGILKRNINKRLPRSYTFNEVIKNNRTYYIPQAGISPACVKCVEKDTCKEKAGILVPVNISHNTIIGALGMFAYTEEDKNILNRNFKDYIKFIEKMAELLSSKIEGEISSKNTAVLAKNFKMIIEENPQCILAISSNGFVTHFNKKAQDMLNVSSEDLLGARYNKVISCKEIDDALSSGNAIDSINSNIYIHNNKKYREVLLTVHPIRINNRIETITCFFQELHETKRIYEKISMNDAKIAFSHIKGGSQEITRVVDFAQRVSPSSSTVLITGETGTGKELFARAIHYSSNRKDSPFIAVNCSAIPEALLESELFGYEGGAFTGSKKEGKFGKFELANRGTIFLDEIGDMPLSLQPKLLRVLQDCTIEKVGGIRPIKLDIRVIAATNKNLEKLCKDNLFREDLYYRLNVIPIHIPPLRYRRSDIPTLAYHFLQKYNSILHKDILDISKYSMRFLKNYEWLGNVRELENVIEYAVNVENTDYITEKSLPSKIIEYTNDSSTPLLVANKNEVSASLKRSINYTEKSRILEVIDLFGNTTEGKIQAANYLGISLSTLYRKLKEI